MRMRRSEERGHFRNEWLDSRHSFSFGEYFDPQQMGFHDLRVINEDLVQPGAGFPTHGHRDMEIITYIIEGTIAHKDSMGHEEKLTAGEVQVMTAGRGVRHSEFNPGSKVLKLLQIWVVPDRQGLEPSYRQRVFSRAEKWNTLCLLVGPEAELFIHQKASIYASVLEAKKQLAWSIKPGRAGWIQLVSGELAVNDLNLTAGDAVAIDESGGLSIQAKQESEFLLFDLTRR